jgi:hypothetical protein
MKPFSRIGLMALAVLCATVLAAFAQKTVEHAGNVSKTATITAIDQKTRTVTLKDTDGNVEDIQCGPEVKRFNELKVGDVVTFSYHAAVVYKIAKPESTAAAATSDVGAVRGQGPKPGGAITHQQKATVEVTAIDPAAATVTVKTADGHTLTAEVEDKKNLEGVKVGDHITITFTEAFMVTVEAPKH